MKPSIKNQFIRNQAVHERNLNMDQQICGTKTVAYRARTDRQTQAQTDKKVKTEGPRILSNDIFYFRTVIIGGPKIQNKNRTKERTKERKEFRSLRNAFLKFKLTLDKTN